MSKPTEGKPAFPVPSDAWDNGLSERRYYIGQALAGFCANPRFAHASAEDIAVLAEHQADHVMRLLYPQPTKET